MKALTNSALITDTIFPVYVYVRVTLKCNRTRPQQIQISPVRTLDSPSVVALMIPGRGSGLLVLSGCPDIDVQLPRDTEVERSAATRAGGHRAPRRMVRKPITSAEIGFGVLVRRFSFEFRFILLFPYRSLCPSLPPLSLSLFLFFSVSRYTRHLSLALLRKRVLCFRSTGTRLLSP